MNTHLEYSTLSKCENNDFTRKLRNLLTLRNCQGRIPLVRLRNSNTEESYGNGGIAKPLQVSRRVDSTHAQAQQGRQVRVRIQKETRKSAKGLLCALVKSRANGLGASTQESRREAGASPEIKNKASSSSGWLGTIKKFFVVVRSSLKQSGKLTRDGPRDSLPVLSIHTLLSYGKVLYSEAGIGERKKASYVHSPYCSLPGGSEVVI